MFKKIIGRLRRRFKALFSRHKMKALKNEEKCEKKCGLEAKRDHTKKKRSAKQDSGKPKGGDLQNLQKNIISRPL